MRYWLRSTTRDGGALLFRSSGQSRRCCTLGEALGAKLVHMSGSQGTDGRASPMAFDYLGHDREGGFQVNIRGQRFSNESLGYSEHAAR